MEHNVTNTPYIVISHKPHNIAIKHANGNAKHDVVSNRTEYFLGYNNPFNCLFLSSR